MNQPTDGPDDRPWVDLTTYDQSDYDRGRPGWYVLLWWLVQGVVFPLTPQPLYGVRRSVLRWFGAQVGRGVVVRPSARFTYPWKVSIGDHSWIGDGVTVYSLDRVTIGCHCVVSQDTYLCTGSHDIADPAFGLQVAPIAISNGAWVATACFIAPGVTVGANAVVGARSNVFADVAAGQVAWGSPCKARYPRPMRSRP